MALSRARDDARECPECSLDHGDDVVYTNDILRRIFWRGTPMYAGHLFCRRLLPSLFTMILGTLPVQAGRLEKAGKTGIEWVTIPGGKFIMGADDIGSYAQPRHEVTIKSFQMAKTLVTNKQYRAC